MFLVLLLLIIIIVMYAPTFRISFRVGNKEFLVESSEVHSSETSET